MKYLVEYLKPDGQIIILGLSNNRQLKDTITSLTDKMIAGSVIGFKIKLIE